MQLLIAVALLVVCALFDHLTGTEISFSIAYVIPVALSAWYAGAFAGVLMAFVASLVWLEVDYASSPVYSHALIPLWNSLVRLLFFLIITALLLQVRSLLGRLQGLAETDNLTGLANSRSFYARLELERERALRYLHPFTIAYLDLDNFKQVNDTWGHETGDRVLKTIASSLTDTLRKTDLVARLGGDEFAILLAESGPAESGEALHKLHDRLLAKMTEYGWPVGGSLGAIVCIPPLRLSAQNLVHQADELMYLVKRSGKNRIEIRMADDE